MSEILLDSVETLVGRIEDGAKLAIVKNPNGVAMEAVRALLRRGVKDLHLVGVPTSGMAADLLIGAGAVATLESSAITLDEQGQAPCFARAVKAGTLLLMDSTCPAVYAGLQAAEKGNPFMPLRGLLGTDVLRHRADYKVIDNPFAEDDRIVLLPAIRPDVALFHAAMADGRGNVWIGRQRELMLMAHAARETLVTVEEIRDTDFLQDEALAPGTISTLYVTGVARAVNGAWPMPLPGRYAIDGAHVALYAEMAASEDGFARYLAEYVLDSRAAAE